MNAATRTAQSVNQSQKSNAERDALITEHLSLVTVIAAHIQKSLRVHVELDDLVHAGTMGLFDAANKYEAGKDVAFPTYAKFRIRGSILDSLRRADWASREVRKRFKQMTAVKQQLALQLDREPTEAEIAKEIGLDTKRWQALMVDFHSLNAAATHQMSEREDQASLEVPSPASECPDEVFARTEMRRKLNVAMQTLPKRYQQVVTLYYERDMTMKEIGGVLKINESRVSQIHKTALGRMQSFFGGTGISSAAGLWC